MAVLAVAHRAGNSVAGLRAASALGVDVVECDVHEYRGRLEVRHLKTAGPLPVLWDLWELASSSAPRLGLHTLLEASGPGATLMLDLKGRRRSLAHSIARLLAERDDPSPLLVCGRYWPTIDVVAEVPGVRPVLSARNRLELARLRTRFARGRPAYGVSVHRSLLDRPTVAWLHDRVEIVMTWPVNDLDSLEKTLTTGVSGIISESEEVLAALVGRRDPA